MVYGLKRHDNHAERRQRVSIPSLPLHSPAYFINGAWK